MDISNFLTNETITPEEKAIDDYKKVLFDLVDKHMMNMLQYTYFSDFERSKGTIICLDRYMDEIKQIESSLDKDNNKDNSKDNNKDNKDLQNNDNNNEKVETLNKMKKLTEILFKKFIVNDKKTHELRINKNIIFDATIIKSIDFTNEQKSAIIKLLNFMYDNETKVYGLYGYAGTGKTTTMVELVSYLISNGFIKTVVFTAPTNKAVNVIKGKFKPHLKKISEKILNTVLDDTFNFDDYVDKLEQRGTKIHFITIHKLLLFQTDYSVSGDTIFVRDVGKGSMLVDYELTIIDECSMINMDMIDSIFEELRTMENKKSKNYRRIPKVIFTGDPAQLPPVNEEDSSIFCTSNNTLTFGQYNEAMNYKLNQTVLADANSMMLYRYNVLIKDLENMKTFLLKKVVRSRIDNVTKVCYEFRQWINSDTLPELHNFVGEKGIHFYDYKYGVNKITTKWFNNFLDLIKKGDISIILTWTNKQSDQYNDVIRKRIFSDKSTMLRKFEVGDILMLSDFYNLDLGDDFVKQKLYTSEQIKVLHTELTDVPISSFDKINNAGIKKMKGSIKIEDMLDMLVKGLNQKYCMGTHFKSWVMKTNKLGENTKDPMMIVVIDDTDRERYTKIKDESNMVIKNFTKHITHQYKSTIKQIEKFVVKPLWKQWNKIFVSPFANVNYGYSITCHKAQGSNFYDVFVDLNDILQNPRGKEGKKCAYTAVTRACNELHILV